MKIGLYCGSFNPVHKGHVKIATECLNQKLVDKVLIVATGNYWDKNIEISLADRINMLKMYETSDIEIEENLNNLPYTYDIFKTLKEENPDNEYILIVGADNIENFDRWNHYQYLLDCGLIVVQRAEKDEEYMKDRLKQLNCNKYSILKTEPIDASSSYIRKNLDSFKKVKHMLDRKVYDYLINVARYQNQDSVK